MADLYADQDGNVSEFADQGEAALRGARALTPEEQEQYAAIQAREAQYGGALGGAITLGTSALSGASLGLSDLAADAFGLDDELRAYREVNPGADMLGQIGGAFVGLGKFGGGAGAIGRGGRALLRGVSAPSRALFRGGAALERGVAGVAGRGSLLPTIAREAFEGGVMGMGHGLSEYAIQDRELTAELLASEGLKGAALGGLTAGGLGLVGKGFGATAKKLQALVRRGSREGFEGLADAATGQGGILDRAFDALSSGADVVNPGVKKDLVKLMQRADDGEFLVTKGLEHGRVRDTQADDFVVHFDRGQEALQTLERTYQGVPKEQQIRKAIPKGNEVRTFKLSEEAVDRIATRLHAIKSQPGKFAKPSKMKDLEQLVERLQKGFKGELDDVRIGDSADRYMRIDELKRAIGPRARRAEKKMRAGPQERATYDILDEAYEDLRMLLEDTSTWGQAGKIQQEMNAAWSSLLDHRFTFERALSDPIKGKHGGVTIGAKANRDKVGAFFHGLRRPNKTEANKLTRGQLERMEEFARSARNNLELSPSERAAFDDLLESAQAMRKNIDTADEAAEASELLEELGRKNSSFNWTAGLAVAGGAVGGPAGAAAGGTVGRVVDTLARPGDAVKRLAAMHGLVGQVEKRLGGSLDGLAVLANHNVTPRPRVGEVAARGTVAAQPLSEERQRYMSTVAAVRSQSLVAEGVAGELGELVLGAPDMTAAAVEHSARIQSVLARYMPEGVESMAEIQGLVDAPETGDAQVREFLGIVSAIEDPAGTFEGIVSGEASYKQVDAVRQAYPVLFDRMRQATAVQLAELRQQGRELPHADKMRIGLMLDLPTDHSFRIGGLIHNASGPPPGAPPAMAQQPSSTKPLELSEAADKATGPQERAMLANEA